MRTTLTLDDDVAARLKAEMRRTDRSLRETVNDALREGLSPRRPERKRFRVIARDLGNLQPGLSLDNVAELLERAEGPRHR